MTSHPAYKVAAARIDDLLEEGARQRLARESTRERGSRSRLEAHSRVASVLRRADRGRPSITPESASPRRVFALVVVAAFLATLDMFIVSVAFPAIQAGFHGASPVERLVGAERLCDRVRGAARADEERAAKASHRRTEIPSASSSGSRIVPRDTAATLLGLGAIPLPPHGPAETSDAASAPIGNRVDRDRCPARIRRSAVGTAGQSGV